MRYLRVLGWLLDERESRVGPKLVKKSMRDHHKVPYSVRPLRGVHLQPVHTQERRHIHRPAYLPRRKLALSSVSPFFCSSQ